MLHPDVQFCVLSKYWSMTDWGVVGGRRFLTTERLTSTGLEAVGHGTGKRNHLQKHRVIFMGLSINEYSCE